MLVNHSKFGIGEASFINNGDTIEVKFDCGQKLFKPEWVSNHLDIFTDVSDEFMTKLNSTVSAIKEKKLVQEKELARQREVDENKRRMELLERIANRNKNIAHRVNRSVDPEFCKMFYSGATDVAISDDHDLYFIIGFIAGHADRIYAQMTWDRVETFLSIFPDAEYHEVHRTSQGRDTDCCFRIIFPRTISVPDIMENMLVQTNSGYQLAKSAFVFKLAHDYGIMFGDEVADVAYIRSLASDCDCDDDFVRGFFY